MNLIPLPAFDDNYLWLLHNGRKALVVDPGDADPVFDALKKFGLQLDAILVTHHHGDHVGGVAELRDATGAQVWGPAHERMPEPITRLSDGDTLSPLGLPFVVLDTPGHTAGHIAYYCPSVDGTPVLFCGDTLFSGGCGRLFEGTPAQMLASLDALAALPGTTRVCCAHEYTLANLKFAKVLEPFNAELTQYIAWCESQRTQGLPTLPSTLARELQINPFMRTRQPELVAQALKRYPTLYTNGDVQELDPVAVFAALRQWKNEFK